MDLKDLLPQVSNGEWLRTRTIDEQTHQNMLIRAVKAPIADIIRAPSSSFENLPSLLIASRSIQESGYYIFGGYPPNFITIPGEKPTNVEAIASINQALSVFASLIVLFNHHSLAYPPLLYECSVPTRPRTTHFIFVWVLPLKNGRRELHRSGLRKMKRLWGHMVRYL